jgi:hypothetical protein
MKKLLTIPAYLWAIACLLLIPVTFIGNDSLANKLSKLPFMKVNPLYSGGELSDSIKEQNLDTYIYKPVFEAFIGESREGFVQIRFSPAEKLPDQITKSIDFDNDGTTDFEVNINTRNGETILNPSNPFITKLIISSKVKKDWIVRVGLKNQSKNK